MSQADYTYRSSKTSCMKGKAYPSKHYPPKYYKNYHSGKYQEEEPMSYQGAFRLRVLFCILLFAAFVFMDGKLISQSQKQFLYQRLEEPMTRQTAETWAQGIKSEYNNIRIEIDHAD